MTQPSPLADAIRAAAEHAAHEGEHADELAANVEALESRGDSDETELAKAHREADLARETTDTAAAAVTEAALAAIMPTRDNRANVEAGRAAVEALRNGKDPLTAWRAHIRPRRWRASEKPPPEPPAVLWRYEPGDDPDRSPPSGRVLLTSQTVGLLSGEGGCGKSSLTQQLALAAAAQTPTGAGLGDIRLAIAPGPVIIWQLEDRAALVLHRLRATADRWNINPEALDQVAVVAADDTAELWRSADFDRTQHGPTEAFAALAADIAVVQPRLVIIDPALCAVLCAPSDAATVRAFVATVARLVGPNAAVLIVAHSTKEARTNAEGGPGVVSGSAAWYDAARLVINAHRPRDTKGRIVQDARQHVLLDAVKANLGEAGQIGTGTLQVATSGRWPAGLIPTATPADTNGEGPLPRREMAPLDPVNLPYA